MAEERPQLHMSRINRIWRCGIQDEFIESGKRMAPGISLIVGTETHKTVEANLNNKINTGELLPVEQIQDLASDGIKRAWDEQEIYIDPGADKSVSDLKDDSIDMTVTLSALHALNLAPIINPKAVERKWVIILPEELFAFDLAGTMDIEEIDGTIRDTKTTGKNSVDKDAALVDDKLDMYGLAKQIIDNEHPPILHLDFLQRYTTPAGNKISKIVTRSTIPTPERNRRTLARVEKAQQVIKSGIYTPAPPDHWACSKKFCGFWSICKYWSGK